MTIDKYCSKYLKLVENLISQLNLEELRYVMTDDTLEKDPPCIHIYNHLTSWFHLEVPVFLIFWGDRFFTNGRDAILFSFFPGTVRLIDKIVNSNHIISYTHFLGVVCGC